MDVYLLLMLLGTVTHLDTQTRTHYLNPLIPNSSQDLANTSQQSTVCVEVVD